MSKLKVIVRGPALTQSGYGEHCRHVLRSLRKFEDQFDVSLWATAWGQCGWISADDDERRWMDILINKFYDAKNRNDLNFDISVQVTIPNEFERLAPRNIGISAGIETDRISPQWIEKCALMDQIITISEHSRNGFINTTYQASNPQTGEVNNDFRCLVPVDIVPYPVKNVEPVKLDHKFQADFNFLTVCQYGGRKNLDHTIAWFCEEFKNNENVGLVLKVSTKNNSVIDRELTHTRLKNLLKHFPGRKCKVELLHGDLTEGEMVGLLTHPQIKAMLSLSHGEGFGLPLFEAAYNGLPIVTHLYSGQSDFLQVETKDKKTGELVKKPLIANVKFDMALIQPENVWEGVLQKDSSWCYPKPESAKEEMRKMFNEYPRFKSQAERLQKYVCKKYDADSIHKKQAELILGKEIKIISRDDIPKVSIFTSVFNGKEVIESFMVDVVRQTIFDKIEWILVHSRQSKDFEFESEVIKPYLEKYPNFKYIIPESEDGGVYWAWAIGVDNCTGEFCANRNLDDRMKIDQIEIMAKELMANEDVGLVYCDSYITTVANETWENNTSNGRRYSFPQYSFECMKMGLNLPHCNPLYRRSLHKKYGNYDSTFQYAGDFSKFLEFAAGGEKFKKTDEILGLYLHSATGVTTDPTRFPEKRKEEKALYLKYKDVKLS